MKLDLEDYNVKVVEMSVETVRKIDFSMIVEDEDYPLLEDLDLALDEMQGIVKIGDVKESYVVIKITE